MKAVSVLPLELDGHVEMALPWYVNGTLSETERGDVELHLSECAQCRASHHLEVLLQQQLHASGDMLECTPEFGWARLSGKLDVPVAATSAAPTAVSVDRSRPARRGARRRLMPLLLFAQAAAIAALAFALIHVLNDRNAAPYKTLTDSPTAVDAAVPTLRVVFADDATSASIRTLLSEIGGTISAGPSSSNVYTVRLIRATDIPAHRLDETAKWLRSQAGVLFAEPVNSPAPD